MNNRNPGTQPIVYKFTRLITDTHLSKWIRFSWMNIPPENFQANVFPKIRTGIAVLKGLYVVLNWPSLECCLRCMPRASLSPLWPIFLPGSSIQGERERADPLPFCTPPLSPPPSEFPALTLTSSSYMGATRQGVGERLNCVAAIRVAEVYLQQWTPFSSMAPYLVYYKQAGTGYSSWIRTGNGIILSTIS